jgi:hypothetical protein
MSRLTLVFGLASLVACLPTGLRAQNGMGRIVQSVAALDKNFDIADTNRDGKLSKAEARGGPVAFIASHFDAIDTGHTGLVSKQDVHAYIVRMLMRSQPAHAASTGKPR